MKDDDSPEQGVGASKNEPDDSGATAQNGEAMPRPRIVSFGRESLQNGRSRMSLEAVNENSPLLLPRQVDDGLTRLEEVVSPLSDDTWTGEEEQESKSTLYLAVLALGTAGLQIAWSVEMSNGSPYLLSLGLSKSLLALVWIAGPLSGTLVQPYVGLKSDNCRVPWGKRRPFIVGGAVATIISLLCLAWARSIVGGVLGLFGADRESSGVAVAIIIWAVLFVYILDFSINVIQAAIRAFIVDCAPTHQQEDANAWASRLAGLGNILGYLSGYVNLPKLVPFLGNTQFRVLCAIAAIALAVTVTISCLYIRERDPRLEGEPSKQRKGVIGFFKDLFQSVKNLPPQIRRVCEVQFFAWIGWFPFLFYITTYVGEIYAEPFFAENPNMTKEEIDVTWEHATRIGTFALLIFAITTFVSSVVLPFIIVPSFKPPAPAAPTPMTPTTPGSLSASGYFSVKPPSTLSRSRWRRWKDITAHLQIDSLTLRRAWLLSHVFFAACMWFTFAVRTTLTATILVALVGIPWAITQWAPFALISAEISKRDAIRRGAIYPPPTEDGALLAAGEDDKADQAGVVLGIHNVAIAAPQVIATLVSSLIFKLLQKPRGSIGDDSVAWVLRFGGLCALIAAWWTRKVGDEREDIQ